jgi:hypothetical protein
VVHRLEEHLPGQGTPMSNGADLKLEAAERLVSSIVLMYRSFTSMGRGSTDACR